MIELLINYPTTRNSWHICNYPNLTLQIALVKLEVQKKICILKLLARQDTLDYDDTFVKEGHMEFPSW